MKRLFTVGVLSKSYLNDDVCINLQRSDLPWQVFKFFFRSIFCKLYMNIIYGKVMIKKKHRNRQPEIWYLWNNNRAKFKREKTAILWRNKHTIIMSLRAWNVPYILPLYWRLLFLSIHSYQNTLIPFKNRNINFDTIRPMCMPLTI